MKLKGKYMHVGSVIRPLNPCVCGNAYYVFYLHYTRLDEQRFRFMKVSRIKILWKDSQFTQIGTNVFYEHGVRWVSHSTKAFRMDKLARDLLILFNNLFYIFPSCLSLGAQIHTVIDA